MIPREPVLQLTPEFTDRLKAELKALALALEQGRKVANYPDGRHPLVYANNPLETPLPHAEHA